MRYIKVNKDDNYVLTNGLYDEFCVVDNPNVEIDKFNIYKFDSVTRQLDFITNNQNATKTATGEVVTITNFTQTNMSNLRIFGKTTTDFKSTGDDGGIILHISNENLFNVNNFIENGSIDNAGKITYGLKMPAKAGKYTFSNFIGNGISIWVRFGTDSETFATTDGIHLFNINASGQTSYPDTKTINQDCYLYLYTYDSDRLDKTTLKGQIKYNNTDTTYVENIEQVEYISIPNNLRGIKVTTDGNYTDANGQQWVCDEVNMGRGVIIQRIGFIQSYNGQQITTQYMSSTGELSSGAQVIYVLDTPVESTMSAADMSKLRYIVLIQPTMTITNDKDAGMEANYFITLSQVVNELYKSVSLDTNQYLVSAYGDEYTIEADDYELINALVLFVKGKSIIGERMVNYYPDIIKNILELKAITNSEGQQIDNLKFEMQNVLKNAYLHTMDEARIAQWERKLQIVPMANSTVDDRRDVILARIRGKNKLNTQTISSIVNVFTGGTANSWLENGVIHVEITPPPSNKQYMFENVEAELRNAIPAHLGLVVTRKYHKWGELLDNNSDWQAVKDTFANWEAVLLTSN